MKLIKCLFFVILLFSQIAINLCYKSSALRSRYRRHRRMRASVFTNKWAELARGAVVGFTGTDLAAIVKTCISNWNTPDSTADPGESTANSGLPSTNNNVVNTILNTIVSIIDKVCAYKSKLLSIFQTRRLLLLKYKKNKRTFFEKRDFLGIGAWISGAAKTVGTALSQLGQTIATTFNNLITEAESKLLEAVVNGASLIKNAVTGWFSNSIIGKVITFATCASSAGGAAAIVTAATKIKGIISLISGVISLNVVMIIKVIINLICNWQKIAAIVTTFQTAFSTTDVLVRYYNIGSAVGQILSLLGSLSGFRRHRRLVKK